MLHAYRHGLFPMPIHAAPGDEVLAWWSPDPRGIIPLDGLHVTRSLRQSQKRYTVTFDVAFEAVIDACADPSRSGRWINDAVRDAYVELHRLGWAHSVEAWAGDGSLAGGLYGIAIGGLFAGESMFHDARDASKVALVSLVAALRSNAATQPQQRHDARMLDVQWLTPHLASLGAIAIPRSEYLAKLGRALREPLPPIFQESA